MKTKYTIQSWIDKYRSEINEVDELINQLRKYGANNPHILNDVYEYCIICDDRFDGDVEGKEAFEIEYIEEAEFYFND